MRNAIAVAIVMLIAAAPFVALSDESDAADTLNVSLYDSQGKAATGILFDTKINTSTRTENGVTAFVVDAGTPLSSGKSHLSISFPDSRDCVLRLSTKIISGFITDTGLIVSFYSDKSLSPDSLVTSMDFRGVGPTEYASERPFKTNTPYYITIETAETYRAMQPADVRISAEFTFKADIADGVHELHLYPDEDASPMTIQVLDGRPYGELPVPSEEGKVFLGWYTDPVDGVLVTSDDIVDLDSDQNLYAHWMDDDEDSVHIITDHGSDIWIRIVKSGDKPIVRVDGKSPSGRVTSVFETEIDGGRIPIDVRNNASDLTLTDAIDAREQFDAIKGWLEDVKGIGCGGTISLGPGPTSVLHAGAAEELSKSKCEDFVLGGKDVTLGFDKAAMASLSKLDGNVAVSASRADSGSMTPQQAEAVGDAEAYIVSISDGKGAVKKIDGKMSVSFDSGNAGAEGKSAYMVSPDGTKQPVEYSVDGHRVTVTTDTPSVYFIGSANTPSSCCCCPCLIILLVAVIGFIIIGILWIYADRKERREE